MPLPTGPGSVLVEDVTATASPVPHAWPAQQGDGAMDVYASGPAVDQSQLAAAVADAHRLLRYAAEFGIALPEATVAALVHAKACTESGMPVPEAVIVAFYTAYATLASRVQ